MTPSKLPGVFLAAVAALGFLAAGCRSAGGEDAGAPAVAATAKVRTSAVEARSLVETVEAFGSVAPAPGATHTVSVPFEARIRRVVVTEGARVAKGSPVAELDPGAEARLELAQAADETAAAREQRDLLEQRLGLRLATRPEVQQAAQRLRAAEIKQEELERRLAGSRVVRADAAGTVVKVDAQGGQVLPPETSIVQIVVDGDLAVRLGVEPRDASRVKPGLKARFSAAGEPGARPAGGRVAFVAAAVNPSTRLVDVVVRPDGAPGMRLNEYVRGRVETGRHDGLVVPREAIVPDGDESVVFIVDKGHAMRRVVKTGLDDGTVVEITGDGIAAGVAVVVEGNAELEDGMAVVTAGAR